MLCPGAFYFSYVAVSNIISILFITLPIQLKLEYGFLNLFLIVKGTIIEKIWDYLSLQLYSIFGML